MRGRERGTRRDLARSNLQQCFRQFGSLLSLSFYKENRNTSSAIRLISILTPASHLHSVSFTFPFHSSALRRRYISPMITYRQFLRRRGAVRHATPPASKAGGRKWREPEDNLVSPSFLPLFLHPPHPTSQHRARVSTDNQPPNLLIKSRSLLYDPCTPLQGPAGPPWDPRPDRMSRLSAATNEAAA